MTQRFPEHAVDLLRQRCRESSQRPYLARGANTSRCPDCLMAPFACLCESRQTGTLDIDILLLYHRDEIHKPTNSGRLIADLFPDQTHAYLWSRTEPSEELLTFIHQPERQCCILFPSSERQVDMPSMIQSAENKRITFILLDGTWKQASKMFHLSKWLHHLPAMTINSEQTRSFLVRHAKHDQQFATAEVASLLLHSIGEQDNADRLFHYYQKFNQGCLASRRRAGPGQ